jgi:hypothetical protein
MAEMFTEVELIRYIDCPEADSMKLERWTTYLNCKAMGLGYHGRFTLDKPKNGHSRLIIYKNKFQNARV